MGRKAALAVATIMTSLMAAAIVYGIASGGFVEGVRTVLENPWGRVTLVDLVVGFVLAGAWLGWREQSVAKSVPWWIAMVVTGNLALGIYVIRAAWTSMSIRELLLGNRS